MDKPASRGDFTVHLRALLKNNQGVIDALTPPPTAYQGAGSLIHPTALSPGSHLAADLTFPLYQHATCHALPAVQTLETLLFLAGAPNIPPSSFSQRDFFPLMGNINSKHKYLNKNISVIHKINQKRFSKKYNLKKKKPAIHSMST